MLPVLASRWANPENRRREAVRAAHDQDAEMLADLLDHYLTLKSARKSQVSDHTRRLYRLALRRFLMFCGPPAPGQSPQFELTRLTSDDVEAWLVGLQREGMKPGTIAAYLYGVRTLYKALAWAGAASNSPTAEVKAPRDPTPAHSRKSALSPQLYRELLALAEARYGADDPRVTRDGLLIALGGSGGLRASEIVGLDVDDLELRMGRLTVHSGKGGKRRTVPLSRSLATLSKRWLEMRGALVLRGEVSPAQTALLVAISNNATGKRLTADGARFIAKGYYQALGLPPEMWGLHTLRRTAGTHLYRATRDLHVVADVLGHASVNTSAIYAKMDMEVRREALEKMEALRDQEE